MNRLVSFSQVSSAFSPAAPLEWAQALAICAALMVWPFLSAGTAGGYAVIATLVFLIGGLPHGAFDIHRAALKARLGRRAVMYFLSIYVALVLAGLAAWRLIPELFLPLFILSAVAHFSEDWPEIEEPFFRIALGFAPICVIGAFHPGEVFQIFAAMANPSVAEMITKSFVLFAPVTVLVAAAGLAVAFRQLSYHRAAAFGALLAVLAIVPPLIGFALFFCAFHTPRHMQAIRADIPNWPVKRMIAAGGIICVLALILGIAFLPLAMAGGLATAAAGFQLLAALALPHQSVGLIERAIARGHRL